MSGHTTELQAWLHELRAGNPCAQEQIINRSCERLRGLARKMLRGYPRLQRWEQTDDVLQNAMIRLHRSLAEVQPESVDQFVGLAATQIRRTLLDLLRHHFGPEGSGARHHTDGRGASREQVGGQRHEDASVEPDDLDDWTRFHETIEGLPEDQREVVNLLWYAGLSHAEAASLLGVNERTIRRRWLAARCAIFDALDGEPPQ